MSLLICPGKMVVSLVRGSLEAQLASVEDVFGFGHKKFETGAEAKMEGELGSHLPLTFETV